MKITRRDDLLQKEREKNKINVKFFCFPEDDDTRMTFLRIRFKIERTLEQKVLKKERIYQNVLNALLKNAHYKNNA